MVDPQAVDRAGTDLVEDQAVRGGEDVRVLLAQTGESGDVEEAPVVQLGTRDPPEAQPVMLMFECGGHVVGVDGPGGDGQHVVVVDDRPCAVLVGRQPDVAASEAGA